jgi:UDP-N-acetylmuramoyl-L-alanyl-D-glutamate--2,6-diaminopimelate ligase
LDDIDISGLSADSREIKSGYLFAAFDGVQCKGSDFIDQAIKNGAIAILVQQGTSLPQITSDKSLVIIEDENPRQRFAYMAANMYQNQPNTIVAVTGSNGKTSVAHFVRQIWQNMDHAAAALGTIGIESDNLTRKGSMTTPDPVTLHSEISELEASGVTHLAMEASSHGLDQYRLDGLHINAAGFTNLTRDHLDYHETMENYFAAKSRLFADVLPIGQIAVLNADIPQYDLLKTLCQGREQQIISYGKNGDGLKILHRDILNTGQLVEISVFGEKYTITLNLVGEFQLYNILCAAGLVMAEHINDRLKHMEIMNALENITGVRGRLEYIGQHPNGAPIYIDYAHTPDALENVLTSLRPHTAHDLHVIIGCGGNRDRGKRPMMGSIAAKLADHVIVTDDNPRNENPDIIRSEIMSGCADALEIDDRRRAIQSAILGLKTGDILVITGKGHEQGQVIGDDVIPFDDATEARTVIAELG